MEEREALKRLKHREEDALAWFIDRYTAYVSTIVSNILGPAAASADLEAIGVLVHALPRRNQWTLIDTGVLAALRAVL